MNELGEDLVLGDVVREHVEVVLEVHEEGLLLARLLQLELLEEEQCVDEFVLHEAAHGSGF